MWTRSPIANASSTLVAQRIGAGDMDDAHRVGWHGLEIGLAIAALMGGFVFSSTIGGQLVTKTGHFKPFMIGGGAVLIGSEHDAKGRDHHIEAAGRERQRFRVGLDILYVADDAGIAQLLASHFQHRIVDIRQHHFAALAHQTGEFRG